MISITNIFKIFKFKKKYKNLDIKVLSIASFHIGVFVNFPIDIPFLNINSICQRKRYILLSIDKNSFEVVCDIHEKNDFKLIS